MTQILLFNPMNYWILIGVVGGIITMLYRVCPYLFPQGLLFSVRVQRTKLNLVSDVKGVIFRSFNLYFSP